MLSFLIIGNRAFVLVRHYWNDEQVVALTIVILEKEERLS